MSKRYFSFSLAAIFVIGGFFVASAAHAVASGPNFAGTGSDASGVGTAIWSNPTRIIADDGSNATVTFASPTVSHYLAGTGFGFAIPTGATITGIQVVIQRDSSTGSSIKDNDVRLLKAGSVVGDNKAITGPWPNPVADASYGSAADLWGTTWTAAEVNDAGFGVALSVGSNSGTNHTGSVDHMQITVTYNEIQPKLTVTKVVVNDNGGTKVDTDFALLVGATSVASGVQTDFDAGDYTISETADTGYAATITGDCAADGTITLAGGDVKTCTITNDDIAPLLQVTKNVVNDNGGTAAAGDFIMGVAGPTDLLFAGSETGTNNYVDPGSYTVTESGPAGYALTYLGNCDSSGNLDIDLGESKNCTLTNDDQSPHLTVIVSVVNDNGGTLVDSSTSITVTGVNILPASTFAGDSAGYTVSLDANEDYNVAADDATGYTTTLSTDCDGTMAGSGPGPMSLEETRTCTITFDDTQPKLTVTKVVVNDNEGTKTTGDFALFVGTTPISTGIETGFDAGAFVVSETADATYAATFGGDCGTDGGITLFAGDVKTCTITNDDIEPIVVPAPTPEPEPEPEPTPEPQGGGSSGGGGGSAQLFTITSSADLNGIVNPLGALSIASGNNYTVTITPNTSFTVADVIVDGTSVGAVASHTFTNITANHTISAIFAAVVESPTLQAAEPAEPTEIATPTPTPTPAPAPIENPAVIPVSNFQLQAPAAPIAVAEPSTPAEETPTTIAENTPQATTNIGSQTAALSGAGGTGGFFGWLKQNFIWLLVLLLVFAAGYWYFAWPEKKS